MASLCTDTESFLTIQQFFVMVMANDIDFQLAWLWGAFEPLKVKSFLENFHFIDEIGRDIFDGL